MEKLSSPVGETIGIKNTWIDRARWGPVKQVSCGQSIRCHVMAETVKVNMLARKLCTDNHVKRLLFVNACYHSPAGPMKTLESERYSLGGSSDVYSHCLSPVTTLGSGMWSSLDWYRRLFDVSPIGPVTTLGSERRSSPDWASPIGWDYLMSPLSVPWQH